MCRPYPYAFQAQVGLSQQSQRKAVSSKLLSILTQHIYLRKLRVWFSYLHWQTQLIAVCFKARRFVITAIFDTLAYYAKKLKAAGFTEDQAEIQTQALAEIIEERLATKQDLKELELRLKHDLTLRLGGMLVAGIAIVATLVKLL